MLAASRIDFFWYKVEYTFPDVDNEKTVYVAYVYDVFNAGEDCIRNTVRQQIYHHSGSLLKKDFPFEIKSITCVGEMYKED